MPAKLHLGDFVRLGKGLSTDDDLTTISRVIVGKLLGPHLLLGAHKLAHSYFDLTDRVVVTATVTIDHDELVILNFLEEVGALERCLKVWVQLVLDLFSLTNLNPLTIAVLLKQKTLRVRLAECVHILEFAS